MKILDLKYRPRLAALILIVFLSLFFPCHGLARPADIKKISIEPSPLILRLHITGKVPVKVVKVEPKELLVALKDVRIQKGFKIEGQKGTNISNIAVENLTGGVVAVVLNLKKPVSYIRSEFNQNNTVFSVRLEKKAAAPKPAATKPVLPEKQPAGQKTESVPVKPEKTQSQVVQTPQPQEAEKPSVSSYGDGTVSIAEIKKFNKPKRSIQKQAKKTESAIPTPSVYVPPKRDRSKYKGDITDIAQKVTDGGCDADRIINAIQLLRNNNTGQAYDVLDQYILQGNVNCLEEAFYLRAYAFFESVEPTDFPRLIEAERMFQDALINYPKSDYVPYGYAAIGLMQMHLNNISAAEGYFNIIKQGYLEYTGLAEIMYQLARIYDLKGYQDKALTYYKQVFEDTEINSYIADAGVGYGKALFNKRQYLDSLSILNYVVEANPKKVYEDSNLLLYIGNANYEVGLGKQARASLTRVLNLFPDVPEPDVLLSRVGDTYGMENNEEKAIKVYELVREKYPDTEGYVASSIGIARYLQKDEEKMDIYQMVKLKFPENKYSRIAMMRLAEIYKKQGEYDKCIKEIEDLLATHPRGLRYEAVKLMQKAYEQLFKSQLKTDEFTQVLNRYELEHNRIDRMGSRQLELSVGLSYLEARLYEEAFNHLIMAYKQYPRSARSADLLYGLGVAMDETGRDDDALKMYGSFAKRFPKDKRKVDTLNRSGQIYLEKKKHASSSKQFNAALKFSKSRLDKGFIHMAHAMVYEDKDDFKTASRLREKAVREIALASGENYDILASAYKELGRTYIVLKQYVKSAEAYDKALNFSKDEREKANLGFLLGDAYQKGNILSKAKEAYQKVVDSYDSVWARMAQQRLDTLELAQTLENT